MKYSKENYITPRSHPNNWKYHTSVWELRNNSRFIKGNVLDIGCNCGTKCYWFSLFEIEKLVGTDINRSSIEIAEKNFKSFPYDYEFIQMNAVDEKLDRKFDFISCFHVFEHIYPEDVDSFLSNVMSMLSDDGYFLMSLPYDRHLYDPCHVGFYNVTSLSLLMRKAGFKVLRCYKEDRYDPPNILTGLFAKA